MSSYSNCCNAALIIQCGTDIKLVCRDCGKTASVVEGNVTLTQAFNAIEGINVVSPEVIKLERHLAKRYATDPTLGTSSNTCKKCKCNVKYYRDQSDAVFYICPKCRDISD